MKTLPINLDDLVSGRSVESVRREFKKSWTKYTREQTIRTICAFANDIFNLNGGYVIIGIEEKNGLPILPPHGLDRDNIDQIQKDIRGNCRRIDPEYQPVLSPEIYQDRLILVIWAPGGELRPYQAPKTIEGRDRTYYVRIGPETVEAQGQIRSQLFEMAAKVTFDDRRNPAVPADIISPALVRNFLADIKSDLVSPGTNIADRDLFRSLRLTVPVNTHQVARNIALLFFVNDPAEYFPGARIEVVQFGDDSGGDLTEEKVFRGPLHFQIRQAINYLDSFSTTLVSKIPGRAEAARAVSFPYEAMEEAIVNAVYHRSYEVLEPVKVYLYPNRMEIISYPGPVAGIQMKHLRSGAPMPPVPNRNRRIGEFLKDLRLAEGRGTGIPKIRRKMSENGSPEPLFDFDPDRTYFRVVLPAHPQYIVIHSLREGASLWATGERQKAVSALETAWGRVRASGALMAQIIEYRTTMGDFPAAERIFAAARDDLSVVDRHLAYVAMARAYLDRQNPKQASEILKDAPHLFQVTDIVELAILQKRAGNLIEAHKLFASSYDLIKDDPRAVHEYAKVKMKIASSLRAPKDSVTWKQLTREAAELLHRAVQLSNDPIRTAWCWFDLAKVLGWLKAPETEVLQAYGKATEILPNERRFLEWYEQRKTQGKV